MNIHFPRCRISFKSEKEKGDSLAGFLFTVVLSAIMGIGLCVTLGSEQAAIQGAHPQTAHVQAVTFEKNEAIAHLQIPSVPTPQRLSLHNNIADILPLVNQQQATLTVIQKNDGSWRIFTEHFALFPTFFGTLLLTIETIFAANFTRIKRRKLRMVYPFILVAIMWAIWCYYGAFHWFFIAYLLPPLIGWHVLSKMDQPQKEKPVQMRSTATRASRVILLAVGLVFGSVGFGLQWWMLTTTQRTMDHLQARETVLLTPHLSRRSQSGGGRGSSDTTYDVLVSYTRADKTRHYVELSESNGELLSREQRSAIESNFWRLYNGHPVIGSVSKNDPDHLYASCPTQEDFLLANERWNDIGLFHGLRLFALPFYFIGLYFVGVFFLLLLLPKGKCPFSDTSTPLPQCTHLLFKYFMLPATLAFSLYQWLTVYGNIGDTFPIYSFIILLLPVIAALIGIFKTHAKMKKTGYYQLTFQEDAMGLTFTLLPPQHRPPKVETNTQRLTPVACGDNQWRLTWSERPSTLQITTAKGPFFLL